MVSSAVEELRPGDEYSGQTVLLTSTYIAARVYCGFDVVRIIVTSHFLVLLLGTAAVVWCGMFDVGRIERCATFAVRVACASELCFPSQSPLVPRVPVVLYCVRFLVSGGFCLSKAAVAKRHDASKSLVYRYHSSTATAELT